MPYQLLVFEERICIMSHHPLVIQNLSLYFPHKICFEGFSKQVHHGSRIGIIGRNGNGKTTLLKIIQGLCDPSEGTVFIPKNAAFGYVPQIVENHHNLSGGQRFNKALSQALACSPNILCLDEPTNHLDGNNRSSLIRLLKSFDGTLFIVTHDRELLRSCIDEIWHVEEGKIACFSGSYDDYEKAHKSNLDKRIIHREQLEKDLRKTQKTFHAEEKRAAQSRKANEHENDRKLKGFLRDKGSAATGLMRGKINKLKKSIKDEYEQSRLPEIITPTFSLTSSEIGSKAIVTITNGECGYLEPVLKNITLNIGPKDRVALAGDNGSGKSTLVKAIAGYGSVITKGSWALPKATDIGYFDQHYNTLDANLSVFELIAHATKNWTDGEIRKHLNSFLFRKNEEVMAKIGTFSGGEKARAMLALIAAQTPRLLILDEVTNNLDIETKDHVAQVLKDYPGAMIVISHDQDFLEAIRVEKRYLVENGKLNQW